MAVLEQLKPEKVFYFFEELCKIPHGTYDTKRISDYCVAFAKERNLQVVQDEAFNVIICKPGTKGYEESQPVILQGHMDMVCEKRPGSDHDFQKDGLDLYVEDGYVKAKDTTLGGDDGIAVAMMLALLDSDDIPHPPLEAVITTDEEEGMGGAMAIDLSILKGQKLINIDSEEEGVLTTGCAGGFRYEAGIPVVREEKEGISVFIRIHGLQGGHSGIEIHKQRGNAHKLMGRLLNHISAQAEMNLVEISGGSKDNVISMESIAKILINAEGVDKVNDMISELAEKWKEEFMGDEPRLQVETQISESTRENVCDKDSTMRVITYLTLCPNGVLGYSRKLSGMVETSLNLGIVETTKDTVKCISLVRSSLESKKEELKELLNCCVHVSKGTGTICSEYPAWQFKPDSDLRNMMEKTFEEMFGKAPEVSTIHAGLECGLFLGKRPDLDCVSFGPNILDVHSFHERLDIASVERMWSYLLAVLLKCR